MNNGQKLSVACIDDDPDFRVLLGSVFLSSELFELQGVFHSIEEFIEEANKPSIDFTWLPDVLVVDVMLGNSYDSSGRAGTGATFVNELRKNGAKCAIVLVSSMNLDKVISSFKASSPGGWRALLKTSRLTSGEILNAAVEAAEEMKAL